MKREVLTQSHAIGMPSVVLASTQTAKNPQGGVSELGRGTYRG